MVFARVSSQTLSVQVQNPADSLVLEQNIWGKALNRIVVNGISPAQAADKAIERIEQIFDQWQRAR